MLPIRSLRPINPTNPPVIHPPTPHAHQPSKHTHCTHVHLRYGTQVRDLAFFIEAQRTINEAAGAGASELREGTVLPLPEKQVRGPSRRKKEGCGQWVR